jgi:hypothetical protein
MPKKPRMSNKNAKKNKKTKYEQLEITTYGTLMLYSSISCDGFVKTISRFVFVKCCNNQ